MNNKKSENFYSSKSPVKELSPQDFDSISPWKLNNKDCSFVFFYAPWCPYCERAKDDWEKFARSCGFVDVFSFNCEKYKNHTLKIKEDLPNLVSSFPTFVFYKKGEPVETHQGERNPESFIETAMRVCSENFQ